jgi:2'-5' RNA ligase
MARLFFALWPDEAAARRLAELSGSLAARSAGKPVPLEKVHLTLAFLGELAPVRAEAARQAAAQVRSRAFALELDEVGSFRSARVAWAGCVHPPPALEALQRGLAAALRSRDFVLEERPFAAHVTLARKTGKAIARAPMAPIVWQAREFTLVRSETGTGRYVVTEAWPLG